MSYDKLLADYWRVYAETLPKSIDTAERDRLANAFDAGWNAFRDRIDGIEKRNPYLSNASSTPDRGRRP